jgi:hypothetical protein
LSSFGGSEAGDVNFNSSDGSSAAPVVPTSMNHLLDANLLSRYTAASKLSLKVTDAPSVKQQPESLPRSSFEYLLSLPLSQLTSESLQRTNKLANDTASALASIRSTSPEAMWKSDLLALKTAIQES